MGQTTINAWISDNADRLKRRLSIIARIDEDAFQDAYLSLVKEYPKPESSATLENAFIKIYRRIEKSHFRETYETLYADEAFLSLIPSDEPDPQDRPRDRKTIADRIRKHIRSSYPQRDVTAFEMRMKGFSYRDISDTIGIGTTAIYNHTERIIAQTRLHFAAVAL